MYHTYTSTLHNPPSTTTTMDSDDAMDNIDGPSMDVDGANPSSGKGESECSEILTAATLKR